MRLIDGDALKQTFCAECTHTLKCSDCDIDYHFEKLAPTIQQPYFIQLKNIVSNDDFRRVWEDLKHQCENIVLLHEYEQLVYPTQRWISCTERLPENTKRVLVAFDSEDDDDEERIWTQIGEYHAKVSGWTVDGWIERASPETFCRVLAWMPLPEPYKEENK